MNTEFFTTILGQITTNIAELLGGFRTAFNFIPE